MGITSKAHTQTSNWFSKTVIEHSGLYKMRLQAIGPKSNKLYNRIFLDKDKRLCTATIPRHP